MARSLPKNWIRHQVERRVRPSTSSARSVRDTALHVDDQTCEPSLRRKWRRFSKVRQPWYQSRVFFVALLLVLAVCLSWTCWLLLLTVAPNDAINYVMRTKDLDNGSFWMLVEPTPTLRALSLAGLLTVAIGYLYIGAMLLAWEKQKFTATTLNGPSIGEVTSTRDHRKPAPFRRGSVTCSTSSVASIHPIPSLSTSGNSQLSKTGVSNWPSKPYQFCLKVWYNDSDARKIAHVWVKVADLMLQIFMLYQTLEAGYPLPLVVACTLIVVLNALAVVALMHFPLPPSQIGEAFVDAISDVLVAVGFPVLVLGYCLTTFDFDHESQRLASDLFPSSSFQNAARVHANPEQTATVFKSLEGLRFQSVEVCIARIGNNLALLISLRRLVKLLRSEVSPGDSDANLKSSIYPRKHPLAMLLVAIALGTVVFVAASVHHSEQACQSFPTCTMHAYRWWLSDSETSIGKWNCPCRVLIDVDLAPTRFSLWKNPPNASDMVSTLAASGDLEILEIINRQLPELPEPLRRCRRLKHIALVFTHTITLPSWASEFTELEFLHIQGKSRALSLASLPQGLFAEMKKLTFVHLGDHMTLTKLPDVGGLANLRSITMARLGEIATLPADFARLSQLEIVLALMIPKLKTFPDLARSRNTLKSLVIDACPMCCDGFLRTACDLTSSICGFQGPQQTNSLTCLPVALSATSAALEVFRTFNSTICVQPPKPPGPPPEQGDLTTSNNDSDQAFPVMPSDDQDARLEHSVEQCGGILHRECKLSPESNSGICYSDRYMPISCMEDPNTIEWRRVQIKRHIGPPCNPMHEEWLGCKR